MRSFAFAFLCAFLSAACNGDEIRYMPAPAELIEVELDGSHRLSFLLPDPSWRRVESDFKGFIYGSGGRTLQVAIGLKKERHEAAVEAAHRDPGADVLAFEPGTGWPYVGVAVAYRGPPDAAMLEAFRRSFRIERR